MELSPTAEQQALKDAVERFCQEQITPERLQAWEKEPRGIDIAAWRAIADLGWFGLGIPEARGGSGRGLVDVGCLLQECARGLVPRSVINAIRAGWALARLDPDAPELEAIGRGEHVVALALDEQHASQPDHFRTAIEGAGNAARVTGEKWFVANGVSADSYVVAAREANRLSLVLVAGAAAERRAMRAFDNEEQAAV
ncbi:MAG: acyl-CoA dehydrogenase family protein, partial [Candidatus Binatia bacterium]